MFKMQKKVCLRDDGTTNIDTINEEKTEINEHLLSTKEVLLAFTATRPAT